MVAALDPQPVRGHQDIDITKALRRLELVARELDLEPIGVLQIDRVHETAIALQELDAAVLETSRNLGERGARHVEREMLHAPHLSRRRATRIRSGFVREHREEASIARVEIEMVLVGLTEIGLLENKRHP